MLQLHGDYPWKKPLHILFVNRGVSANVGVKCGLPHFADIYRIYVATCTP